MLCKFFLFLSSKVCVLTFIVDRLQPVNSQSRWFNFSRLFHHLERYFLPAFTYHDRKFGRRRDLRHARWLILLFPLINSSRSELTRERRNSLFLVEINSAEEEKEMRENAPVLGRLLLARLIIASTGYLRDTLTGVRCTYVRSRPNSTDNEKAAALARP